MVAVVTDPRHWVLRRGGGGGAAIPRGGAGTGRGFLGIAPWLQSLAGDRGDCQKGGATVTEEGWTDKHPTDTKTDKPGQTGGQRQIEL